MNEDFKHIRSFAIKTFTLENDRAKTTVDLYDKVVSIRQRVLFKTGNPREKLNPGSIIFKRGRKYILYEIRIAFKCDTLESIITELLIPGLKGKSLIIPKINEA